jgi:hypothetical protein
VSFVADDRLALGLVVSAVSADFCAEPPPSGVFAVVLAAPDRERRRREGAFGAAPFGPSASVTDVPAPSFWAVDVVGVSPFAASVAAPGVAVPVPGRLRPRPPRRRRRRAGAAAPLSSVPVGCGDVVRAVSDGATADSIPASLTKRSFLSGHAGFAGHARTER